MKEGFLGIGCEDDIWYGFYGSLYVILVVYLSYMLINVVCITNDMIYRMCTQKGLVSYVMYTHSMYV